jgi:DNA-binding transcriptional ArsR family regulator
MEDRALRRIGDILKDRNIILKGADAATSRGFTQVPNFLLRSPRLSPGDKLSFAMLLSYAWHNDSCFPGQQTLAKDLGLTDRSVRTHLKSLEAHGLLEIRRRGLGKTNVYVLNLKRNAHLSVADRKKTSGLEWKGTSEQERKPASGPL